jgi:surface carbohydrate biosynthesis protein
LIDQIELYIPIEVKHRELYAKTLLAMHAARRGFSVTLGRKAELDRHVVDSAPGVYYGLGTSRTFAPLLARIAEREHLVTVSDEEGLVTYSDHMYLDLKVAPETLHSIDLLFTWGQENSNVIARGRPDAAAKLRATGNPRFDLLKTPYRRIYDSEVNRIGQQYRPYALICTSFGSCNHYIKDIDYVQSLVSKNVLTSPGSIEIYRRFQKMKSDAWHAFLAAIPMMARAYPKIDFVIRPHPSENPCPYEELAHTCANVHLDGRFSIHPWLFGARGVVHHYCTSAVEAFAAGVPTYALRPSRDSSIEKEIPYECSENCASPEELVDAIGECLSETGPASLKAPISSYSRYVTNIDGGFASELIVDELCRAAASKRRSPTRSERPGDSFFQTTAARVTGRLREVAGPLLRGRRLVNHRYITHKFDRLSMADVEQPLQTLAGDTEESFDCRTVGHNMVRIRRRNSYGGG